MLRRFLLAVLVFLPLVLAGMVTAPPDASAGKRLAYVDLKWQNRLESRTACTSCTRDTSFLSLSTANVCSTSVFDISRAVSQNANLAVAADSVFAWLHLVSDSSSVGDLTNIRATILGVSSRQTPTGPADIPANVSLGAQDEIITASRVSVIPLTLLPQLRSFKYWQVAVTSLAGTAGRLKAYVSYYVDE
jgi:hypothetical protein